jgi:signal transduction histidine kinase
LTPEAVIDRYLETALRQPLDAVEVVRLLGTDADLLSRWLQLLACPADPDALQDALTRLPGERFEDLAIAQALAVLTVSGSVRLSFDQWQSVLNSSLVGERLAEELGLPDPLAVRWRVLLAASGVHLPQDAELSELLAFRGARRELLEDASVVHRLFAVVESLDVADPLESQEAAGALLGLAPDRFQSLLAEANGRCDALLEGLGLHADREFDAAERLWLRLQVALLGRLLSGAQTTTDEGLVETHTLVCRRLFGHVPVLLLQDAAGQELREPLHDHYRAGPVIRVESQSSTIARSVRLSERCELIDRADQSVADRQVLRQLGTGDAVCYPLATAAGERLGAVVFAVDEDVDQEALMVLYAEELGRRLGRRGGGEGRGALERYRRREEKRLRELVHEANNPLSVVNNYLHILELTLTHEPQAVQQLQLIGAELRRVAEIIAGARELSSADEEVGTHRLHVADVDVNELARRVVTLHGGYAGEHRVAVSETLAPGSLIVRSDEHRLIQVLNNLLRNAIEAAHGATVTVSTVAGVFRQGREGVLIGVADTGPGLPREVLVRLAEPKQSSKGGDHAGLGLHIVHRLVDELDGSIDVRTAPGEGTTFSIFLPLESIAPAVAQGRQPVSA